MELKPNLLPLFSMEARPEAIFPTIRMIRIWSFVGDSMGTEMVEGYVGQWVRV